jgi:hypothetical protein
LETGEGGGVKGDLSEAKLAESNPYYVIWIIFGLAATSPSSTNGSRTWMFVFLILEGMAEFKLSKDPGDAWLYSEIPYTIKELVDAIKYLYPLFLLATIIYFEHVNGKKLASEKQEKDQLVTN